MGRIADFTVMVRPLTGVVALAEAVGRSSPRPRTRLPDRRAMRVGYLSLRLQRRRPPCGAGGGTWPRCRPAAVEVLASSSVYETEPVGEVLDQRDFLNACSAGPHGARAGGGCWMRARRSSTSWGASRAAYCHGPRPIERGRAVARGHRALAPTRSRFRNPEGDEPALRARCPCSSWTPISGCTDGAALGNALAALPTRARMVRLAGRRFSDITPLAVTQSRDEEIREQLRGLRVSRSSARPSTPRRFPTTPPSSSTNG